MRDISSWNSSTIMDRGILHLWVVLLCASSCTAAPVSDSLVVLVESPVSAQRGQMTTLPCWLSPQQSAEDLEVRWYRDNHFTPILHYQAKKLEDASQESSYVGRVSFGLHDAASGGLKTGDVSLKLLNVTIQDAGDYTCYVSSDQSYDRATVSLQVTETGHSPFLTATWKEDNTVNVSCESEGWFPEPVLRWSDNKQYLTPESPVYSSVSAGLVSVHSWILVPSSSEVSCSVGFSGKEEKKMRLRLENPPQLDKQVSGSSLGGWVAFVLLLLAVILASLGAVYYWKKVMKSKPAHKLTEESKPLLTTDLMQHYENIQLNAGNPFVTMRDTKLRDASRVDFPDGRNVTCVTAVRGTPGFSGGHYYWEVSLGTVGGIGLKQSWWVGVTSAAEIPQDPEFSPNTSNGYWFLSSSRDSPDTFQFSTEPKVSLPVRVRPQTIGVYLDYDGGELSFYNVNDNSLIGSFSATFTGEVFPFFNPGKGDKAPMEVLQRAEHGQSNDKANSVDSTA